MESNTVIDGYQLNASGQWVDNSGSVIDESQKKDDVNTAPGQRIFSKHNNLSKGFNGGK